MKNNGFNLLQVIKHKQILKLGYIMERVINVFPKLKFLESIAMALLKESANDLKHDSII